MKHYSAGKRRRGGNKAALVILLLFVVLMVCSVFIVRRIYNQNITPVSSSQKAVIVTIPTGATIKEIGKKLQDQGVIKAAWAFEWYVRNKSLGNYLQAGTYSLRPSQNMSEIVSAITRGKVDTTLVKILPGQRIDQIRNSLIRNDGFTAEEVDAALDPAQYANEPALADKPPADSLEGYLYPDSYQKTNETKPETIIRAALAEMRKHLKPEIRAAFIKQGLTVHEGVILASIIEQEVSNPNDKPVVAQVFLKRRHENMQLGSDVTAFYGAVKAGKMLTQNEALRLDSPYNTRMHSGLPPGPISNVSASSLKAVASPASTDYLYFVAGDDGVTYFSRTLSEHESLTAQHCKKLCQ